MKKRIVIFASGNGTNTQNIIKYFQNSKHAQVVCVLSNNKNAKVLARSLDLNIEALSFTKAEMLAPQGLLSLLNNRKPDLLVLAGFLLKFPEIIIDAYPNKVINIHPALLPKYGGKGMYGHHVHKAVVENKETHSGITIHYVNNHYDQGKVIFQKKTTIAPQDTPQDVAQKVQLLEHQWLPKVIEDVLTKPSL
ncbi:MAG TPA: phosphoribosylglycinamide formyltransferase [Flavobacteriaceae bacterium]|nr:phosphoribosylglycinamide formyltransferase [Ulvibacter sp.]HAH33263.1 phosphoribosylglycinamide formyltransferase [Flavobacteriaceae bacterium]